FRSRGDEARDLRPHHRRRPPREPSARHRDHEGSPELPPSMTNVIPLPRPAVEPEERPVLVVDLGGQYSQLIARRVRECRVYSEQIGHRITPAAARARHPLALVLSGGPASVYAEGAPQIDPGLYAPGLPLLGLCYGMPL